MSAKHLRLENVILFEGSDVFWLRIHHAFTTNLENCTSLEFTRLLEILLDQHYINQCEDIGIILEFMQNKKNLEELCLNFDELLKIINVLTTITDGNPEV